MARIKTLSPLTQRFWRGSKNNDQHVEHVEHVSERALNAVDQDNTNHNREAAPDLSPDTQIEATFSCNSKFADLFFNLAAELQIHILCELDNTEIFALRRTCRRFFYVTQLHQSPIVRNLLARYHADTNICECLLSNIPEIPNFSYYYQLLHRESVAHKLATTIADFVAVKIYDCTTDIALVEFREKHVLLQKNMYPILKHVLHFLEQYREALVDAATRGSFAGKSAERCAIVHQTAEVAILEKFSLECLCESYAMFRLLLMVVARKLRPPSYATKLERTLRGWNREPASTGSLVKLIIFGGFEEIVGILQLKSYAARRDALDFFLSRTHPGAEETQAVSRTSYSKKWSRRPSQGVTGIKTTGVTSRISSFSLSRVSSVSKPSASSPPFDLLDSNLPRIDCSILPQLSPETISTVSSCLPSLHTILLATAEHLLIDGEFVDSSDELPTTRRFLNWATARDPDIQEQDSASETSGESSNGNGDEDFELD